MEGWRDGETKEDGIRKKLRKKYEACDVIFPEMIKLKKLCKRE